MSRFARATTTNNIWQTSFSSLIDIMPCLVILQHFASTISIDRKIRRRVDRKTALAVDLLRERFEEVVQARLNKPSATLAPRQEAWFALVEEALASREQVDRLNGRSEKPTMAVSVIKRHT